MLQTMVHGYPYDLWNLCIFGEKTGAKYAVCRPERNRGIPMQAIETSLIDGEKVNDII